MPSQYLDEFIRELRRDGDETFRANYGTPVLIVTEAAGEAHNEEGAETSVLAEKSGWRIQQVSLINRVYRVGRGPSAFERVGPILLGRTAVNDIAIPDDSVSKTHCQFEVTDDGTTLKDRGSTNGTLVGGARLGADEAAVLKGGEKVSTGNFTFLFLTADGFVDYLKTVVKI